LGIKATNQGVSVASLFWAEKLRRRSADPLRIILYRKKTKPEFTQRGDNLKRVTAPELSVRFFSPENGSAQGLLLVRRPRKIKVALQRLLRAGREVPEAEVL